jgi:hypothetical protein
MLYKGEVPVCQPHFIEVTGPQALRPFPAVFQRFFLDLRKEMTALKGTLDEALDRAAKGGKILA